MALEERTALTVRFAGRTAALFRLLLVLERKKLDRFRPGGISQSELAQLIITAYLAEHEKDILEDVNDGIEQIAAAAVGHHKFKTGLQRSNRRHRAGTATSLPEVPNPGRNTTAHVGGSSAPTAAAFGDKAAE